MANLMNAERELKKLMSAPDISNEHRELASEARAYIMVARAFLKEVRARQEEILSEDGQEKSAAQT